jgi:anaerobic selenocysteine-containing dehydrogenase
MAKLNSNDTWLSRLIPFGVVGQTKPRHYREMLGVLWENKDNLPYAWKILKHGVCDGCSLGPYGLRDNVLDGVHLCMTRLRLLRLNTIGALDTAQLSNVARLRSFDQERLRSLGRLPYPMIRRQADAGFTRIRWEEAFDFACKAIRDAAPHQMAFFATSRGLTNEVYYVFQKLARVLGTNNVDLCSRLCHTASVSGLKATLGIGAPTCSLSDFWLSSAPP